MAKTAYGDTNYSTARAVVARGGSPCWKCGAQATTVDHVPALATHTHQRNGRCCELRPACARCNYADGGRLGIRRRKATRNYRTSRSW